MRGQKVGPKSRFLNKTCDQCHKIIRVDSVVLFQYFNVAKHRVVVKYHKDCMADVVVRSPKTLMETNRAFKLAREDLLLGVRNGEFGATKEST